MFYSKWWMIENWPLIGLAFDFIDLVIRCGHSLRLRQAFRNTDDWNKSIHSITLWQLVNSEQLIFLGLNRPFVQTTWLWDNIWVANKIMYTILMILMTLSFVICSLVADFINVFSIFFLTVINDDYIKLKYNFSRKFYYTV